MHSQVHHFEFSFRPPVYSFLPTDRNTHVLEYIVAFCLHRNGAFDG